MINEFQYHKQEEADLFAFYQIPKELFTNSNYKHISTDAKLLYGLLRDRHQLSKKNNWVDDDGNIFIYFSREEVEEILGIKKDKCIKLFKELADVELIKEKRQGLNKPNIIYVGKIIHEGVENQRNSEKPNSRNRKNRL